MLGPAGRTVAPPTRLGQRACCAAIRAEPVTRMPAEQRFGFGQWRQMIRGYHALHSDRTQIGDLKVIARFKLLHRVLVETEAKPRRGIGKPEKYDFTDRAQGARLTRREQRVA